MTYPPPPGQWNPGASEPGQPQPPSGYYPPPGWNPQPPPQKHANGLKWLLIGVAVLLVVAISVGITITVFLARDGSGPDAKSSTVAPPGTSGIASADDIGPVSVITSEPTCTAWRPIQNMLANAESNGWGKRDPSSESSSWTPQVRAQYDAVGAAMRSAADQVVPLVKQTPHRVMRELYQQFIVYGRAYADSLSSYEAKNDLLSQVNIYLNESIGGVCNAVDYSGMAARAVSVAPAQAPTKTTTSDSVNDLTRFVSKPSSTCAAWVRAASAFQPSLADWGNLDPNIPATAWTAEQRGVQEAVTQAMGPYATTMEDLGRQASGAFEDFATLAALYLRAYIAATPSYIPTDSWMAVVGIRLNNTIVDACKAAAG